MNASKKSKRLPEASPSSDRKSKAFAKPPNPLRGPRCCRCQVWVAARHSPKPHPKSTTASGRSRRSLRQHGHRLAPPRPPPSALRRLRPPQPGPFPWPGRSVAAPCRFGATAAHGRSHGAAPPPMWVSPSAHARPGRSADAFAWPLAPSWCGQKPLAAASSELRPPSPSPAAMPSARASQILSLGLWIRQPKHQIGPSGSLPVPPRARLTAPTRTSSTVPHGSARDHPGLWAG